MLQCTYTLVLPLLLRAEQVCHLNGRLFGSEPFARALNDNISTTETEVLSLLPEFRLERTDVDIHVFVVVPPRGRLDG